MLPTCEFYTMLHHVSPNFLPSPKSSAFRGISGFSPEITFFQKNLAMPLIYTQCIKTLHAIL